jgi:hypothetical protein
VDTVNRRGSDLRTRLVEAFLAVHFSLAPSSIPWHQLSIQPPPAYELMVGEPVRRLRP